MRTAALLTITALCVWALAPYLPAPVDIFNPEPQTEVHPLQEIKPSITSKNIEWQIFDLINEQREAEGLLILIWDRNLQDQTRKHSELMVATQNYAHSDVNVYENIYWGINVSPHRLAENCFEAWMKSKGHRENIVEPSIRRGAVGIAGDGISTFATFMAK